LWVCFAAVCSKRLRFHSCSRLLQFLSRHCFIIIIAVWVTCFAIIASVCSIFHLDCYMFTCGYFSPVWFRDRLFRRVLFEAFAVSFLFEAFVVSFSTLLQYNLLPWESLQYQIGYGQLVRIDPWLIDPWLCIRSVSRRNSNKIAHGELDNKVMPSDSCFCSCCSCSRSCCFSIQGRLQIAFNSCHSAVAAEAILPAHSRSTWGARDNEIFVAVAMAVFDRFRVITVTRKKNSTPFKQSVNMNCSASHASTQLAPFLCHWELLLLYSFCATRRM